MFHHCELQNPITKISQLVQSKKDYSTVSMYQGIYLQIKYISKTEFLDLIILTVNWGGKTIKSHTLPQTLLCLIYLHVYHNMTRFKFPKYILTRVSCSYANRQGDIEYLVLCNHSLL